MSQPSRTAKLAAFAAAAILPLTLVACGETTGPPVSAAPGAGGPEEQGPPAEESPSPGSETPTVSPPASPSPSPTGTAGAAGAAFGPGCAALPRSGPGSPAEMAEQPVATAAASNPALSTLAGLVRTAGLVDTLNDAEDITVFAPSNDAFTKVDPATLRRASRDPRGLLTEVLTAHVVEGRLAPDDLAGEHRTLNAEEPITVTGSGESFTVNDSAAVVCGNLQTANATVYVLDEVLLPGS